MKSNDSSQVPIYNNLTLLVLSDVENAVDFFVNYIPPITSVQVDWEKLRLETPIKSDEKGTVHISDLLFSAPYKETDENAVFLLFLEHKSSKERSLPIQLNKYVALELDKMWNQDYPRVEGKIPCPIAIVLYHGKEKWVDPPQMADCVYVPEEYEVCVPHHQYILIDTNVFEVSELKGGPITRVFLELLKRSQDGTLEEYCRDILSPLSELNLDLRIQNLVKGFVYFIINYHSRKQQQLSQADVTDIIAPVYKKESSEMIKSILDIASEEGWLKGRVKGRDEGMAFAILALLKYRFGMIPLGVESQLLALSSPSQLEYQLQRAYEVKTLWEFTKSLEENLVH